MEWKLGLSKHLLLVKFCCILLTCSISFNNAQRTCKSSDFNIFDIEIVNLSYLPKAVLSADGKSIKLLLEVNWDVNNPENVDLDGFAVVLFDLDLSRNVTQKLYSIQPENNCHSGHNHMWVRANSSHCDFTSQTIPHCASEVTADELCLCPQPNCNLLPPIETSCKGTRFYLGEDVEEISLTVKPTTRTLDFPILFHRTYQFQISAYKRQFINQPAFVEFLPPVDNCVELLLEKAMLSHADAHQLCCEEGIQHLVSQNFSTEEAIPDFATGTINKTITWLPPASKSHLIRMSIMILSQDANAFLPDHGPVIMIPLEGTDVSVGDNCSYNPKHMYETVIYNLLPNHTYGVQFTSVFNDSLLQEWCDSRRCTTMFSFLVEDISVCDTKYGYCDPRATCDAVFDELSRHNATCECGKGLSGNGLNKNFGEGCDEIDSCLSNNTGCAEQAICIDQLAPETGINCSCSSGYYGDGLAEGSGCRPSTVLALAIALPLVILLVIAIAIAIWIITLRRRREKEMLFSQFVIDGRNGILHVYENPDALNDGKSCEPTFGNAWEIDKRSIEVGEVLGRGNYGVVNKGWMLKKYVDKQDGGGGQTNGNYEAIFVSEKDDPASTEVAIKQLQEGSRSHENLANFLAEIGFLLNIGKHENIVKVYGCCTIDEPVYLVIEYMKYEDLLTFLLNAREPSKVNADPVYNVSERSLCTMAQQVAKGMAYLDKIRIIHGDIAARNILVGNGGVCKISDFGLANDVYRYGAIKGYKEKFVPLKWISPERMMMGEIPITSKSDVWSFGNLMYEIFTLGCPPHPGVRSEDLLQKLKEGYRMEQPRTCNDQLYAIMKKCWQWRASSRPNCSQLVNYIEVALQHSLDREKYASEFCPEIQLQNGNGRAMDYSAFTNNEDGHQTEVL